MRIAFISQYFFPEQFSNNQIAAHLVNEGHDVDVVCCVPNYGQERFFDGYSNNERRTEIWNGVRVHRARTHPRGSSKFDLFLNYLSFPVFGSFTALRVFGRKNRPDVSFVSMPSPISQAIVAIILKRCYGTPCVYWVQDIWPESLLDALNIKSRIIRWILHKFCGYLYRQADFVLVQSAALPEMITRFGIECDKIGVLPNTAPDSYRPVSKQEAAAEGAIMQKGDFKIVFAGNVGQSQDFETVLDAAVKLKHLAGVHWYIIGSGRNLDQVITRVQTLDLVEQFSFLGRHPEDRMPYFFAHADALMVSLIDREIFRLTVPYKLQCYLACGKPVAAMLTGEGARILESGDAGAVAPAGDATAYAAAIETLVKTPPTARVKIGQNARILFETNYSQEVILRNLTATLVQHSKPMNYVSKNGNSKATRWWRGP